MSKKQVINSWQMGVAKSQRSEVGGQKSEIRGQKSEVEDQSSALLEDSGMILLRKRLLSRDFNTFNDLND